MKKLFGVFVLLLFCFAGFAQKTPCYKLILSCPDGMLESYCVNVDANTQVSCVCGNIEQCDPIEV